MTIGATTYRIVYNKSCYTTDTIYLGEILMSQSKLHTVLHTVNWTLVNTYTSSIEELLINKLPKDIIHKSDIKDLIHYGSLKTHIGNTKHCFYYQSFNTI